MTLEELKDLAEELIERWHGGMEVAVSGEYLSKDETVVGHYEPTDTDGGPIILVVGKKRRPRSA